MSTKDERPVLTWNDDDSELPQATYPQFDREQLRVSDPKRAALLDKCDAMDKPLASFLQFLDKGR